MSGGTVVPVKYAVDKPNGEDGDSVEKRMLLLEFVEGGLLRAGVVGGAEKGNLQFPSKSNCSLNNR